MQNRYWNQIIELEYESLRLLRLKEILLVDSKCRKLKIGKVPWSRALQEVRDEILLWSKALAKKQGIRISTRFLARLERNANIHHSLQYSIETIKERKKEVFLRYYELKKKIFSLWESWIQDLAASQALHNGGN